MIRHLPIIISLAASSALAQTPTPSPTPAYPVTVAFASPVSTTALVGEEKSWNSPAVRIDSVTAGTAVFRLAAGPSPTPSDTFPHPDYPWDARTLACEVTHTEPAEVAADIVAYVAQPVSPAEQLARAKTSKQAQLRAAYDAAIAAGSWTTGGDGLAHQLDIGDAAQAEWIKALTALRNAQDVLGFDPATQSATDLLGPLLDKAGQPVGALTVTQFRGIMVSLTSTIGAIRDNYVSKLTDLGTAQSVEAVNAITP